jgi:hypothetical protein
MEPIVLVSGDGHLGAPDAETYRPYLEVRYRDSIALLEEENKQLARLSKIFSPQLTPEQLEAIDHEGAARSGGLDGAWDVKRRMKELDREGVSAEIVFPGHQFSVPPFFSAMSNPCPADLRPASASIVDFLVTFHFRS